MKESILTATAVFLIAGAASLQAAPIFDAAISAGIKSDYYFRGQQRADSIVETEVDFTYGDAYAGIWFAEPFEARDSDIGWLYSNELNVFLGQSAQIDSYINVMVPVILDVGITGFYYPERPSDDNPTWEPYVGLSFETLLNPSGYVYYDLTLETWTLQGTVSHTFELDNVSGVTVGAFVGFVSPDEGEEGAYYGVSAKYGYRLNSTTSVSFGVGYTDGEDARSGMNWDDGLSASLGLSIGL
ncbi:MAG: hypothetical protein BWY82_00300 [Verrucomicrobia bacterium ADurb.Bin474]|nr:MAG: hypothetical protein BWY82_00300 [Verrucomicrobia bacterium ADurb.Bin474]